MREKKGHKATIEKKHHENLDRKKNPRISFFYLFVFFFFFFYFTLCISELAYSIQSSLDLSAMLLQILVTISIILG